MLTGFREGRAWVFLLIGLGLAVLTGVALYRVATVASPDTAGPVSTTGNTAIFVAAVDIPPRTVVSATLLARRDYPAALVPAGAVTTEAQAVGQTTLAAIARGQPIVAAQLANAGGSVGASLTVPSGKVLVAFPTTDLLTINGLVHVGDRIDVLASVAAGTGDRARATQTTLQNLEGLEVLSPTKEQPSRATALVFAVDHQVALVLKYLRDSQAAIDVAIRSRAESGLIKTTSVDLGYLTRTYEIAR
jgi:Flp pilus assembly protein CpaB